MHAGPGRRSDDHGGRGRVPQLRPAAGTGRRRPLQGVLRPGRRDGPRRGLRHGRPGTPLRRPPQRPPGAGRGGRQRHQPGRRLQRPDRPQRPLAAARHPRALAGAGLTAADVDAVEAHGTGTTLGDPIEAQALLATYGQDRPEGRPLWLGSVKSNIGHAQQAAGVAGVMKMVLALQHGELPATLHATEPSTHIDWTMGEVRLLTEPVPWPAQGRPRRAGISSFGISGTNAHLILQDPPAPAGPKPAETAPAPKAPAVFAEADGAPVTAWLVSAQTPAGLAAQAERLAARVGADPRLRPADVAWSLAATRTAFEQRAVVLGGPGGTDPRDELLSGLSALAAGQPAAGLVRGTAAANPDPTVFVFPGQGSQWVGMGRELARTSPVFAARLAECEQALGRYVDWSLSDVLAGAEGAPGLERVDVVQPLLWAVMVSLAALWQAAGVQPDAVVGHSQGEIAAAVVAGILTLDDAAKVVALRSQALTALSGRGGMLSVAEPVGLVEARLPGRADRVAVAAVNGPDATVVSGDPEALAELLAECERDGVRARILPVDYASHGPQVDAIREEVLRLLAGISPQPAALPMVSAMTGEHLAGPEADAEYWYASLRAPVRFDRAVRVLRQGGYGVFVEVSPPPGADRSRRRHPGGAGRYRRRGALRRAPVVAGPAPRRRRRRADAGLAGRGACAGSPSTGPGYSPGAPASTCPPTPSSTSGSGRCRRPPEPVTCARPD
ncbi:type I polyketide synthase [Streptacidiphilus sp. 4-A2]|nr:type I polyketide synthase [Streptacidiphilus sp. 4-A2]